MVIFEIEEYIKGFYKIKTKQEPYRYDEEIYNREINESDIITHIKEINDIMKNRYEMECVFKIKC